jgi:hypothetical protein
MKVPDALKPVFAKAVKNSPHILLGVGAAMVVGGTVLACKATLKTEEILFEKEEAEGAAALEYSSEEEFEEKRRNIMANTAIKVAEAYAPAIAVEVGGLGLIFASHKILAGRFAAASAAYAAVDTAFKKYRERVIAEEGEDADHGYLYGVKKEVVETTELTKTGKERKKTEKIEFIDPEELSLYARIFDDGNLNWTNDPVYNLSFLRDVQNVANRLYEQQGFLLLNDVYKMLGFPATSYGCIVGWYKGIGDDIIDFGIYDARNARARDFVNGCEKVVWLDFNVDGIIYDMI